MVTAWNNEPRPKKSAKLWAIRVADTTWRDNSVFVDAVDAKTGGHLAHLICVTPHGYEVCGGARGLLAEGGYDVAATEWDGRGGLRTESRPDFPSYTTCKGESVPGIRVEETKPSDTDSRSCCHPTPGVVVRSAWAEKERDGSWALRFGSGVDEWVVLLCPDCSKQMAAADESLREREGILPPAPPERT